MTYEEFRNGVRWEHETLGESTIVITASFAFKCKRIITQADMNSNNDDTMMFVQSEMLDTLWNRLQREIGLR